MGALLEEGKEVFRLANALVGTVKEHRPSSQM